MKIHPRDLPENIRKHYQVKNETGGKVGVVYKAIKKNHTTIVVWSMGHVKESWHKIAGKWTLNTKQGEP